MLDLLVYTDLDGTLLDHHDYTWQPASQALQRLAAAAVPLIFNSSKTAAEITALRVELDNHHPFIVENGSAVCVPGNYFCADRQPGEQTEETFVVEAFGPAYPQLISQLHPLRASAGYRFRGFADLSTSELAELTGLDPDSAALAQQRHASEPLLWEDSDAALEKFRIDLRDCHLQLLKGGRFYHVMGQVDKSDGMRWLTNRYQQCWPQRNWRTVAFGDGQNDRAMLEVADLAVIIQPAQGDPLQLNRSTGVFRPQQCGPGGWQSAMSSILDQEQDKGV